MPSKAAKPLTGSKAQKKRPSVKAATSRKHYVLDTNVLLHDPTAVFRFQEHDIYLPLVVLEELDRHKKGTTDIARNARQVTRMLNDLLLSGSMTEGFALDTASRGLATGRLFFRSADDYAAGGKHVLDPDVADNQILACAMTLLKAGASAVLVTKDINLRVKALACDVPAQDYRNDQVVSDADLLPAGFRRIDAQFWAAHTRNFEKDYWHQAGRQYARVGLALPVNSFLVEDTGSRSRIWRVEHATSHESVIYVAGSGNSILGGRPPLVSARNDEQVMALNLLNDPNVDFVALLGPAGTGKTLLAVAAGLSQSDLDLYQEVMVTRATVPLGEDIGFLPGSEQEKMDAWLGGTLRDVYAALKMEGPDKPRPKVEIASMSFMRGRSFQGKYIVIDEAQNLTIRQMRALLTRAGEGTKVIVTGNLTQIDTPYLDEGSSGLAWAVKNLQNWEHAGHVIMSRGERSRLASYVEELAES